MGCSAVLILIEPQEQRFTLRMVRLTLSKIEVRTPRRRSAQAKLHVRTKFHPSKAQIDALPIYWTFPADAVQSTMSNAEI